MGVWYRVIKTIKGHRYVYEQPDSDREPVRGPGGRWRFDTGGGGHKPNRNRDDLSSRP